MGGIMGVEVKRRLAWRTIIQAQAEYLLYAPLSLFPFCMVSCLCWAAHVCPAPRPAVFSFP